jgi:hypothetical protein
MTLATTNPVKARTRPSQLRLLLTFRATDHPRTPPPVSEITEGQAGSRKAASTTQVIDMQSPNLPGMSRRTDPPVDEPDLLGGEIAATFYAVQVYFAT